MKTIRCVKIFLIRLWTIIFKTLVISELQPQLPQQQLQPQLPQQQLQPQIPQQQLQPQLPQQQLQPQLPQQQLPQQQQQQLPQQQLPQQQLPQQQQPQLPQQQMPDQPLCTGMNEEYGCRMTCDGRCDSFGSFCFNGVNKCQCYCRFGFVRNANGQCVHLLKCIFGMGR